jgi:uracil phosphoribosyltransferase
VSRTAASRNAHIKDTQDRAASGVKKRSMIKMSKTVIMDHPLVQHKVSLLRSKNTGTKEFKELVSELATLLCYEATRDLPTEEVEIETPIAVAKTQMLSGRKLALVPILRAGLGMVDGMLALIPAAKVGHIGLYRNEETLEPVEYYCKLPEDVAEREVIVLDPMLATGGSACDAITQIKKRGAKSIKFIGIIAAPEGLQRLQAAHPDVDIYVAALDERLNENGYIVPGLGDAGDRIFGTK